jgi:hypothetical protein
MFPAFASPGGVAVAVAANSFLLVSHLLLPLQGDFFSVAG